MSTAVSTPRGRILSEAVTILKQHGAGGLTVRAVATASGCSTTGVYTYFGGKNGLVEAIYVDGFDRFRRSVRSDADLMASALRYRKWAIANPTHYLVMFARSVPDFEPGIEAALVALGAFSDLVDSVQAAMTTGTISSGDHEHIAFHLWAGIHGYVMLELANMSSSTGHSPESLFRSGLQLLLAGVSSK